MAVAAEPIDVRAAESAGAETPAPASGPRRWLRLGEVRFDGRRNGLNLVRLGLALAVLVSHGYALLGRPEPAPGGEKVGTWAVFGFFAISGYLITGSRLSSPLSAYVLRRLARIYPAFLVCLGVTALALAGALSGCAAVTAAKRLIQRRAGKFDGRQLAERTTDPHLLTRSARRTDGSLIGEHYVSVCCRFLHLCSPVDRNGTRNFSPHTRSTCSTAIHGTEPILNLRSVCQTRLRNRVRARSVAVRVRVSSAHPERRRSRF